MIRHVEVEQFMDNDVVANLPVEGKQIGVEGEIAAGGKGRVRIGRSSRE
jgi:hypothetical protein